MDTETIYYVERARKLILSKFPGLSQSLKQKVIDASFDQMLTICAILICYTLNPEETL